MKTLTNILDDLEQFATDHLQINSFGIGHPDDISTKDRIYPIMWVTPYEFTGNASTLTTSFKIYILDLLKKDKSNQKTILNLTTLIGTDIFSTYFQAYDEDDFELVNDSLHMGTLDIPFKDDYLSGVELDVKVEFDNRLNVCTIPKN